MRCYQMDFSKIELESLWGLYEIRGKKEELEKINIHVQTHEDGECNSNVLIPKNHKKKCFFVDPRLTSECNICQPL